MYTELSFLEFIEKPNWQNCKKLLRLLSHILVNFWDSLGYGKTAFQKPEENNEVGLLDTIVKKSNGSKSKSIIRNKPRG